MNITLRTQYVYEVVGYSIRLCYESKGVKNGAKLTI